MFTKVVAGFLTVASLNVYAQDNSAEMEKRMADVAKQLRREKALEDINALCMENMKRMKVRIQAEKAAADQDPNSEKSFKKDLSAIDKKLDRYMTKLEVEEACDAAASIIKEAIARIGGDSISFGAWGVGGAEVSPVKIPLPGPLAVSPGGKALFGRGYMKTREDKFISAGVFIYGGQAGFHSKATKVAPLEANYGILVAVEPEKLWLADEHNFRSVLSINDIYVGIAPETPFAKTDFKTSSFAVRFLFPVSTEELTSENTTFENLKALMPKSKPVLIFFQFGYGAKTDAGKVDVDIFKVQASEIISGK